MLVVLRAEKERANKAMNEVLRPQERNKMSYWFEFFSFKKRENDSRMSLQ